MKKTSIILAAFVLALGLTQCKKEQAPTTATEENGIRITLDLGSNSRAQVDPNNPQTNGEVSWAPVSFETNDTIYVGYKGSFVGKLGFNSNKFNGTLDGNKIESLGVDGESHLHFYLLGGKGFTPTPTSTGFTVDISDQTDRYPVIAYAASNEAFSVENTTYTAKLKHKASIMKFNVTTPSTAAICITGMNNTMTVNFGTNEFTPGQVDGGLIKMKGQTGSGVKAYWAIVLPNDNVTPEGVAYSEDNNYTGNCPEIDVIEANKYYDSGIAMNVNTHAWNVNSVYLHMNNAGDTFSEGGFTVTATENASWAGGDAGIRLATSEDKLTFESTVGNITKIEITTHSEYGEMVGTPSSGWEYSNHKLTWTGTPSSTVELGCVVSSKGIPGGGPGGGGDEPGIDPGGGGVVIIENAFELIFISQVQFTVQ